MIFEKPSNDIFASGAKSGESVDFPDVVRGWGITENTGFIPPMEYFNGAFNRVDKALMYLRQRGISEWDNTIEYPARAIVQDEGVIYECIQQNTNRKPKNNLSTWAPSFVKLNATLNTFAGENKFTKNTYFGRAFINAPTPELNLNIVHAENGKSIVLSVKTAEGQLENFWLNPTSLSLANKNLDVGKGLIYNSKPQTSANFTDSSLVAFKNSDNAIQYTTVEKLISILKNSLADITTLFGVGQTWQDVKNQRQPNIVYTNATKRPIMVAVTYTVASGSYGLQIEVDGKVVTNGVNASPVIVPAGSTYKAVPVSAATIVTWTELR